jgi:hypothetical protein
MKSPLHAPKLSASKSACSPTPAVPPLGKFPATQTVGVWPQNSKISLCKWR